MRMSEQERWRYPLGEHEREQIASRTGRPLSELTLENVRAGVVDAQDFTIHAETLRAQADIAEQAGFGQLAANLRRAAELTVVPDARILAIYEALRPYRVRGEQLLALADELEREYGAKENARLLREAAEVYQKRGLA
ncbi:MAG: glycerol dehydrogenase [Chloroflexi bacterium]|nr:glycerol dehydrogenase [Chloroflexota bacterium]